MFVALEECCGMEGAGGDCDFFPLGMSMLARRLYPLCSRDQEKSGPLAYRVVFPFRVAKDHVMSWGYAVTPHWKG